MARNLSTAPLLLAAAALAGCAASEPTFGERVALEGGEVAALGESWTEGREAVERGRALVEEGEDAVDEGEALAAEGRADIRRGERLIREGREAQAEAEARYRERGAAVSPPPG
jgi:hypothetical protein